MPADTDPEIGAAAVLQLAALASIGTPGRYLKSTRRGEHPLVTANPACPRCASPMVERQNRSTGEAFLGCSRFPSCRGTLQIAAPARPCRARTSRRSASKRRRREGWSDDVEAVVARVIGRDLNAFESLILGLVLIAAVLFLFLEFVGPVSQAFGQYMASQMQFGPTPVP